MATKESIHRSPFYPFSLDKAGTKKNEQAETQTASYMHSFHLETHSDRKEPKDFSHSWESVNEAHQNQLPSSQL